jgi:predicted site-specific integrase-resolvase
MSEEKKMFTTPQVAQMIGLSESRLRNMIREGKAAPTTQIGGTWLFTLDEIERLRNRPKSKGGRPKKQ